MWDYFLRISSRTVFKDNISQVLPSSLPPPTLLSSDPQPPLCGLKDGKSSVWSVVVRCESCVKSTYKHRLWRWFKSVRLWDTVSIVFRSIKLNTSEFFSLKSVTLGSNFSLSGQGHTANRITSVWGAEPGVNRPVTGQRRRITHCWKLSVIKGTVQGF